MLRYDRRELSPPWGGSSGGRGTMRCVANSGTDDDTMVDPRGGSVASVPPTQCSVCASRGNELRTLCLFIFRKPKLHFAHHGSKSVLDPAIEQ